MNKQFLREPEVLKMVGLSRSTMRLLMKKGKFPQSVKLAERSVAWVLEEVEEWMDEKSSNRKEAHQ